MTKPRPGSKRSTPRRADKPAAVRGQSKRPAVVPPRDRPFLARGVPIIFEDADLLVVEKPVGLITADPNAGMSDGPRTVRTLFDQVKQYTAGKAKRRRGSPPSCYIIHRLDKDASGVLVFAKSAEAFGWLKEGLKTKEIEREYWAVAEGEVDRPGAVGTIDAPLRDEGPPVQRGRPGRPKAEPDFERPAVTHYRVLAVGHGRTLLAVRLETGRKNQIRAHFAMKGHPLLGDGRFGAGTNPIGRLALHARRLAFTRPGYTRQESYESTPPASFHRAVGLDAPPSETPEHAVATPPRPKNREQDTSWEAVAEWYDTKLEDDGSDHYRETILPGTLRLLACKPGDRVLDVACGQGVLCRKLVTMGAKVVGIDASESLIEHARARSDSGPGSSVADYKVCDARTLERAGLAPRSFDAATCIMALSNIDPIEPLFRGTAALVRPGGAMVIVISHPAFRAIGRSGWGWEVASTNGPRSDAKSARQYRRIDAYLSPARSEIAMHPGKAARGQRGGDLTTVTFHRPLQDYVRALAGTGWLVEGLEEWPSHRVSDSGPRAGEENRARREIPMFLGLRAVKR